MEEAERDNMFIELFVPDSIDQMEQTENPHTKRKTSSDMKIFTDWLRTESEYRSPEDIAVEALDTYLANFFRCIRTKKDEEYEPDTLKSIQSSINRYLMEKNGINIMKDSEFQNSRDGLMAKRKELRGKGLDKKHKAEPLTPAEVDILYEKHLLGTNNPEALLNTLWLNNSLHFGMRGRREHTHLLWGDLEIKTTDNGLQYVEYNEGPMTLKRGERNKKYYAPKMFAIPGDPRCPVHAFKEYMRRRPAYTMQPDSRFYLCILGQQSRERASGIWYTQQPLGKNKLGYMMKTMAEKGELTGRKITGKTVVCSRHFKTDDFKWTPNRKTLKPGVVPSVFNWTADLKSRKRPAARMPLQPTSKKVQNEIPQTDTFDENNRVLEPEYSEQVTPPYTATYPDADVNKGRNPVDDETPVTSDNLEAVFENPDHQNQTLNKLYELWKEEKLCDAVLSIGSKKVQVHKCILVANCPYVLNICMRQGNDRVLDIRLPPYVSKDGLKVFVEYLYLGYLQVTASNVLSVEKLAKFLEMKDIYDFCRKFRNKLMSDYASDNDSTDTDDETSHQSTTGSSASNSKRSHLKRKCTSKTRNFDIEDSQDNVRKRVKSNTTSQTDSPRMEVLSSDDSTKMFCVSRDQVVTEPTSCNIDKPTVPSSELTENCTVRIKQEPVDDSYTQCNTVSYGDQTNSFNKNDTSETGNGKTTCTTAKSTVFSNNNMLSDSLESTCTLDMEVECKEEPHVSDYESCEPSNTIQQVSCVKTLKTVSSVVGTAGPSVGSSDAQKNVYLMGPKPVILAPTVAGNSTVLWTPVVSSPHIPAKTIVQAPQAVSPRLPSTLKFNFPVSVPFPIQVIPANTINIEPGKSSAHSSSDISK